MWEISQICVKLAGRIPEFVWVMWRDMTGWLVFPGYNIKIMIILSWSNMITWHLKLDQTLTIIIATYIIHYFPCFWLKLLFAINHNPPLQSSSYITMQYSNYLLINVWRIKKCVMWRVLPSQNDVILYLRIISILYRIIY